MTTSDLEQTLAEARATAARRLEALRRLEEANSGAGRTPAQVPVPTPSHAPAPEPLVVSREPLSARADGPAARRVAPDVVAVQGNAAGHLAGRIPEPVIARAEPTVRHESVGHQNGAHPGVGFVPAPTYPQHPHAEIGYVPVDGVARNRLDPRTALGVQPSYDNVEAPTQQGSPIRDFATRMMQGALAGIATFRENRARSRALAQAESSGTARMPRPERQRLTEKERRWERRRKRHFYEEILGWILVPTILVALYFAGLWVIDLLGTTPDELIEGIKTIWAQFR